MIRKKSLFVKMLKIKVSAWKLFDGSYFKITPALETCSLCQQLGLAVHAYYTRTIIDFINGQPVHHRVKVLRLACSCGHTHAVLFDVIIPYECHSLFFILRVLGEYFLHLHSVENLCERFGITKRRLYSWLRKWRQDKETWLGILESFEKSSLSFLKSLVRMDSYSSFGMMFVCKTSLSFLQIHANPPSAYCAQRVFGPDYPFSYTTQPVS